MRAADTHAAKHGQITLNYQGHINSRDAGDNAPTKLFSKVDQTLFNTPVYKALQATFNNFNKDVGIKEPKVSTSEDTSESNAFLDAVFATGPWKAFVSFLKSKNHPYAQSDSTLRAAIQHLWFDRYSRAKGVKDTSAFEHVFIGEAKNGEVDGLHNWFRYYTLENDPSSGLDYKGFIIKRGNNMASIKYTYGDEVKPNGSYLIGTSPEYDFSVLTMCFLARRNGQDCNLDLDGCPFSVTSYDITQSGQTYIGTSYPTAGAMASACNR